MSLWGIQVFYKTDTLGMLTDRLQSIYVRPIGKKKDCTLHGSWMGRSRHLYGQLHCHTKCPIC